mmetsp:Transcript_26993/g.38698  ORF Transcript_26993/g.38698 Transcript_26993/m.38698 type:complete len:573 (-) Transcript_26993:63-1781(-)
MNDGSNDSEVQPLLSAPTPTRNTTSFVIEDIKNRYRMNAGHLETLLTDIHIPRGPSVRSDNRRRLNIVLGILLSIIFSLLMAVVGFVYYRNIYLPKFKQKQLQKLIREHAAAANIRREQCKGIDWQTACGRLSSASARRKLYTGNYDRSKEMNILFNTDDPAITYDNFCLINYRMKLFGNITFPYHASSRLAAGGKYTMALLIQHGAMRNAEEYFCSFKRLMRAQNYRDFRDILIIAPNFNYEHDELVHPNDVFWNSSKPWGDWRVGAESDPDCCGNKGHMGTPKTFSSYEVLDHILAKLTNKKLFPNMNKISYVGHSAGGQMVQRYAVISTLASLYDLQSGIDIKFIIANPSSYAYLTPQRYSYNCGNCKCTPNDCTCDKECTPPPYEKLGTPRSNFSGTQFPCYVWNYNRWPYGISSFADQSGHYIPYALRDGDLGVERALRFYNKLHVVYLVGQNDTCNDRLPVCDGSCWKRENYETSEWACFRNDMDTRCPAMLQGPYRRARGYQYMKYLETLYGQPTHRLYTIPGVGHNASGMFGSEIGMREIFGSPKDDVFLVEGKIVNFSDPTRL